MSFATFLVVAVLLAGVVAEDGSGGGGGGGGPPEVTISAGRLRGSWLRTRYGRAIAAFEGVPYAAPPVGQLRFAPPRPSEPWSGVRAADKPGSMCLQNNTFLGSQMIQGSEDCLYINVFAPETVSRATALPVMVFIHGGGFMSGEGPQYGPEYLLDREVLLVTFNYRLGALGFFSTGDSVIPGNYGMKDMVLALHWVQDNIRAFGGDPARVTIFGESAGGAGVDLLTMSPKSKGLFQQAIAMSGTALAPWALHSRGQVAARARRLAAALHCPAETSEQLRQCLLTRPAEDLLATNSAFTEWLVYPLVPFRVVVEPAGPDAFLDKHPEEVYAAGEAQDLPYVTGSVSHEGCVSAVQVLESPAESKELNDRFLELAPLVLFTHEHSKQVNDGWYNKLRNFYFGDAPIDNKSASHFIDLLTDGMFIASTLKTVGFRAKQPGNKSPVFVYVMENLRPRSFSTLFGAKKSDEYGMCHADDLLYLFPMKFVPGEPTKEDEKFSNELLDLFVTFATTGRPGDAWRRVEHPDKAEYLHLTSSAANMTSDFAPERMALWAEQPLWRNLTENIS